FSQKQADRKGQLRAKWSRVPHHVLDQLGCLLLQGGTVQRVIDEHVVLHRGAKVQINAPQVGFPVRQFRRISSCSTASEVGMHALCIAAHPYPHQLCVECRVRRLHTSNPGLIAKLLEEWSCGDRTVAAFHLFLSGLLQCLVLTWTYCRYVGF